MSIFWLSWVQGPSLQAFISASVHPLKNICFGRGIIPQCLLPRQRQKRRYLNVQGHTFTTEYLLLRFLGIWLPSHLPLESITAELLLLQNFSRLCPTSFLCNSENQQFCTSQNLGFILSWGTKYLKIISFSSLVLFVCLFS